MNPSYFLDRLVDIGMLMWRASWQASVLALLVLVVHLTVGRRIPPRWRHALWMLVLVRLALPVVPHARLSVFNLTALATASIAGGERTHALAEAVPGTSIGADGATRAVAPLSATTVAEGGRAHEADPPAATSTAIDAADPGEVRYSNVLENARIATDAPRAAATANRHSNILKNTRIAADGPADEGSASTAGGESVRDMRERAVAGGAAGRLAPARGAAEWWAGVVAGVWLVGVAFLAIRVATASGRVSRTLRRLERVTDAAALDVLADAARCLGLRRTPVLLTGDRLFSPALVGVVRPRVIVPRELLERFDAGELRLVFLHELAHLKRRDVATNWFATIVTILHWPNPVAWLAAWRLRVERELACDELVLSRSPGGDADRRAYGETILKLLEACTRGGAARPALLPAGGTVGILEGKQQMKRRITMIARFAKRSRTWAALAACLVPVLAVATLTDAVRGGDDASKPTNEASAAQATPVEHAAAKADQSKPSSAAATTKPDEFAIAVGDLVQVTVFDLEGPGKQTVKNSRVNGAGEITVPFVDKGIRVTGLGELEAQKAIQKAYRDSQLIENPHVAVTVVEHRMSPDSAKAIRATIDVDELVTVSIMDLVGAGVETVKTSRVDADGNINLPYVGLVKASGLREVELEKAIAKTYEKQGLIRNPLVVVSLPGRGESHSLSNRTARVAASPEAVDELRRAARQALTARRDTLTAKKQEALARYEQARVRANKMLFDTDKTNDADGYVARTEAEAAKAEAETIDREIAEVGLQLQNASGSVPNGADATASAPTTPPPMTKPASSDAVVRIYDVADMVEMRDGPGLDMSVLDQLLEVVKLAASPSARVTKFDTKIIVSGSEKDQKMAREMLESLHDTKAATTRPSRTRAADMSVDDIALVDAQMAKDLEIKQEIEVQLEQSKRSGAGANEAKRKMVQQMLDIRTKMIEDRAEWFREKYKGWLFIGDKMYDPAAPTVK
jgi:beta-lactamase regulating signal transducer with metallopeptidase domain/protein involved in polysaccharide export with SLBB domain